MAADRLERRYLRGGVRRQPCLGHRAAATRLTDKRLDGACGRLDKLPVHTVWELVDAGTGCEATVTFVIEGTRGPSNEGWYRRQWSRALTRLRDLVESGEAPPRVVVAGADRLGV